MSTQTSHLGLQLISTVKKDGVLELSLAPVDIPEPEADEVVVRMQACPINPSDLGLLLGRADIDTLRVSGSGVDAVVSADISDRALKAQAGRLDEPLPTGVEGAGVVVKTGTSDRARGLLGKTVAIWGGGTYAQYAVIAADECLLLHEGTTAAEGASSFVNPLTVLGMLETMRSEGHRALVHTAAASNLGQMLTKHCRAEGVELVNIVRKQEQADQLKALGAKYVCNSSLDTFVEDLTQAIAATGATLGFDAIGGGELSGQILHCMEAAIKLTDTSSGRYGSSIHKQVYIYGGLDQRSTRIDRTFGMAWGLGGWLLPNFLARIAPERVEQLKSRVADEIKTTFASHYTEEVSLAGALEPETIARYSRQATGEKFLINPNKEFGR